MFIYRMKGGTFCGSPFSCTLFMVQPSRVSDTPFLGSSPFLGTLYMVHTSCVSNTPLPGWGFRRLRTAGTVSKRIDTPYGGLPVGR